MRLFFFLGLFAWSLAIPIGVNLEKAMENDYNAIFKALSAPSPQSRELDALLSRVGSEVSADPDENRDAMQLIQAYGYSAEEHRVTTADGFILRLHRIPRSKGENPPLFPKKVVFLQHGLLDSSATFLMLRDKSLPYLLSDAGFDVWLGNTRGNQYSNQHTNYSLDDVRYWDHTWDDMAEYDLPASVNYVLSTTRRMNLTYIGHSQGCTIMFAKAPPTLQQKINLFVALAPAPYLANVQASLVRTLSSMPEGLFTFLFGKKDFFPSAKALPTNILCNLLPSVCGSVICMIAGCNSTVSAGMRTAVVLSHFPAGTSTKNLIHYLQSVKDKTFSKFDYGIYNNLIRYGSAAPPAYDPRNSIPTVVFYGLNDLMASPADVRNLLQKMNPPMEVTPLPFGHGDFIWVDNAIQAVNIPVVTAVKKYTVHT